MPQAESTTDVLTVRGVAVRFGGVAALSDANLSVRSGTVTGLIGPNGAGKTTLFNVISGLQTPDRGTVQLYDTDITRMRPHRRARLGLARTFQRLELFGTLSAGENVQVGLESSVKWWQWHHIRRSFPWARRGARGPGGVPAVEPTGPGSTAVLTADRLLDGVGLGGMGGDQASAMPTGLARMVELARALAMAPKILLLDEPGSGLDDAECESLGHLLTTLAGGGMGVLLVEHDMELVMRICDYIYVLDFGDIIAAGTPEEIRNDPMVQAAYLGVVTDADAGVGHRGRGGRGGRHVSGPVATSETGGILPGLPPAVTVRGVRAAYGRIEVLHGVDLEVPAGSVFALLGPNGAGKSTLLKVMSGRMRPSDGEVVIGDTPIGKTSSEKLARQGVCAVPEGRGIFPNLTVRENLRIWTYRGGISMKDVEERTFDAFPVLKERRRQLAGTLSGGEQQMLAISRALVTRPKVLYLDELSMGLAPLIVAELYELVGRMAGQGMTIILVEQFVTTALGVADHAALMVHGRIEQQGSPTEMAEAALGAYLH